MSVAPQIVYRPSAFIAISHGGGPMPLIGMDNDSIKHWAMLKAKYVAPSPPDVILVISAHYHSRSAKVSGCARPPILHDYGGFPPESYRIQFPAPNDLGLAERIFAAFKRHPALAAGAVFDEKARWDHGVFVPLLGGFNPKADIPVVAVSVSATDDAAMQLAIGEALHDALLGRGSSSSSQHAQQQQQQQGNENGGGDNVIVKKVLCLASGSVPHNFELLFNPPKQGYHDSTFNDALKKLLSDKAISNEERKKRLLNWRDYLPNSTVYQPVGGADHFMPLLSLVAAAGYEPASFVEDYIQAHYHNADYIWKY